MAANITVGEAAFLAETLLPYLTVDAEGLDGSIPMGDPIRHLFRRWTHIDRHGAYGAIDWREVVDDVLRPLVEKEVRRTRRSGELYDEPL